MTVAMAFVILWAAVFLGGLGFMVWMNHKYKRLDNDDE